MKKNILFSMCASLLLLASCDYNEDNFPGFDDNPITDVIYYEGEFTGKYPTEGYFSVTQGDEETGKAEIEKALSSMLKNTYPYCDKGSSAKVTLKVASLLSSQEKEPAYKDKYELVKEDYDAMGTGKNEPGEHGNFSYKIDPNNYLPAFCADKYADKAEGFICKITYKYYNYGKTTDESKYYKKGASGWTEESLIPFVAAKKYTLEDADYEAMGMAEGEPGAMKQFATVDEANTCIAIFLKDKYAYVVTDGLTVEVTYKLSGAKKKTIYRYDGEVWKAYDPTQSVIVSITNRITVMKFDGNEWNLSNLISNVEKVTLANAEYTKLVEWVKTNKPEFMSTQGTTSEYYFGADCSRNNINNKYSTWVSYYNVDDYLKDLKDDEIQAIMDKRLAEEGIAALLLPDMISNPDPDTSYTVVYKIYSGRGDGYYAMSFYYNPDDSTYIWDEMTPIVQ